jgi:hypothetical protein
MEIRDLLDEVVVSELETINNLSGEEKSTAIDGVVKLYKIKLEADKNESDLIEKVDARENEQLFKKEQLSHDKKLSYLKIGLEAAAIVFPLIFYGIWMRKGFKFEETGTFTSTTFRNLFGKFSPKK